MNLISNRTAPAGIDLDTDPAERPSSRLAAGGAAAKSPAARSASAIVELFQSIESLRAGDRPFVLQFVAPHRRAGTTTIARGFAQAAASSRAAPVLLISASLADPEGRPGGGPALIGDGQTEIPPLAFSLIAGNRNLWSARLHAHLAPGIAVAPDDIARCFAELRRRFAVILVDCSALDALPQSALIAKFCDGTALVVEAERTTAEDVARARRGIETYGGQILGAVFNRVRDEPAPVTEARAFATHLVARLRGRRQRA